MPLKVLVVDDSGFFRQRLTELIESGNEIKVVGYAQNGAEAVDKVAKLKPDVVTMDYEMPVMDGVTAVRHIMKQNPLPILMLSSMTYEGAKVTLDALEAGAVDFMPKNFAEVSKGSAKLKKILQDRLRAISGQANASAPSAPAARAVPARPLAGRSAPAARPVSPARRVQPGSASAPTASADLEPPKKRGLKKTYQLLAIGTSTGGPVALTEVLTKLPGNFPLPIVLIQHMPHNFTKAFADRLNRQCNIQVKEAEDGDALRPGVALLAPGGKQMMVSKGKVRIIESDERLNYKPCVDVTFGSAAKAFGDKVLSIVLTGMGSDGCDGARMLSQAGSTVWSQDQATSVIYGMPMAVYNAGLSDRVLALPEVGGAIIEEVSRG
ncbi:MAG: chemotaxis response regulator protein-glutamate methylesterase [Cellvibrionaceae bacterium]